MSPSPDGSTSFVDSGGAYTPSAFSCEGLKLHKILPQAQIMVTDNPSLTGSGVDGDDISYIISYFQLKNIWKCHLPDHVYEYAMTRLLSSEPIYIDYDSRDAYGQDSIPVDSKKEIMKDIKKAIAENFENYDPSDPHRSFQNLDGIVVWNLEDYK